MRKARVRELKRAFANRFGHTPKTTERLFQKLRDALTGQETGEKLVGWVPSQRRRIKKLYLARRRRGIPAERAQRGLEA